MPCPLWVWIDHRSPHLPSTTTVTQSLHTYVINTTSNTYIYIYHVIDSIWSHLEKNKNNILRHHAWSDLLELSTAHHIIRCWHFTLWVCSPWLVMTGMSTVRGVGEVYVNIQCVYIIYTHIYICPCIHAHCLILYLFLQHIICVYPMHQHLFSCTGKYTHAQ